MNEINLPILKVNELFCIFLSQNNAEMYFDNKYFLLQNNGFGMEIYQQSNNSDIRRFGKSSDRADALFSFRIFVKKVFYFDHCISPTI